MKLHVLAVSILAFTIGPFAANAQTAIGTTSSQSTWLRDRRYTEGSGYRVGNLELHPGLAGEFGYDSNYLLRASTEDPGAALHLKITPSLSVSTLSPQRKDASPGPPPD